MFQTLAPKDRTDSTGVGLALVKRIVERQPGGRVWVTSRPGQGSTFHFTWPKAPPAATHGQAREPRALERTGEGTSEADHGRA
jgi:light-regulated signal transduction histidine kinase (bacteriophytochrome)